MNRYLALVVIALSFSLTGCGGGDADEAITDNLCTIEGQPDRRAEQCL